MSQVLGAFGLLDVTVLRSALAWRAFLNLCTVYFLNFLIFSGRGQPRITENAGTESADMAVHLYYSILLSTFVGQCTEYAKMHGMNNIKL
jgi:hypothetical protein